MNTQYSYENQGGMYAVRLHDTDGTVTYVGMAVRTTPEQYGVPGARWMVTRNGAQYIGRTRDQAVYHAVNDCHRWVGRIRFPGNNIRRQHFTTDGDIAAANLSGWYRAPLNGGESIVSVGLDQPAA